MKIGDRIKQRRIELNMTQIELAEKANISKQTLYKYENNIVTNIPSRNIEILARILDTTPAYLMGWEDEYSIEEKISKSYQKLGSLQRKKDDIHGKDNASETMIMREIMALQSEIKELVCSLHSISQNRETLITAFTALNNTGQEKLVEYAIDLTKISEYQIKKNK